MAQHNKHPMIGNENFIQWLRTLDPVARVEKMSAIAKTQASAGLRGSLIKASLAQLSQRCQVMLVRLTEKQIRDHTRRKPLKRLHPPQATAHSMKYNVDCMKKDEQFKTQSKIGASSKPFDYDRQGGAVSKPPPNICQKNNLEKYASKENNSKSLNDPNKKLKKKLRMLELFGDDDFDDIPVGKKPPVVVNDNSEREINNYLSTTVNVNIYNSPSDNMYGNNTSVFKRKSLKENKLLSGKEPPSKMLRINVSLSNEEQLSVSETKKTLGEAHCKEDTGLMDKSCKENAKKKSSHKNTKRHHNSSKNKHIKDRRKSTKASSSSVNGNSPEEDPSITELWSIFGMESPTDRSDSIKKSYPLNSVASEENNDVTLSGLSEPVNTDGSIFKTSFSGQKSISADIEMGAKETVSEEGEPFLKITESFSLADTATQHNVFNTDDLCPTDTKCQTPLNKSLDKILEKNVSAYLATGTGLNTNIIETISLDDDDDDDDNQTLKEPDKDREVERSGLSQGSQTDKGKSKVGTIRVKSLGLLIDPQLTSETSELSSNLLMDKNKDSDVILTAVSATNQDDSCASTSQPTVEERFFSTYCFYFDELVESKIPKLGELLHLAIADAIRWIERIKRAKQLSSEDLIIEETQRAEKDFKDMMKIRGLEFSPLFEVIIKRFEQASKITLFMALFCRILKHSEIIDPANCNKISEAKNVMFVMLQKHQFKDKDILERLQNDEEDFIGHVHLINGLIEKCARYNMARISGLKTLNEQPNSTITSNSNMQSTLNNVTQVSKTVAGLSTANQQSSATITSNSNMPSLSNNMTQVSRMVAGLATANQQSNAIITSNSNMPSSNNMTQVSRMVATVNQPSNATITSNSNMPSTWNSMTQVIRTVAGITSANQQSNTTTTSNSNMHSTLNNEAQVSKTVVGLATANQQSSAIITSNANILSSSNNMTQVSRTVATANQQSNATITSNPNMPSTSNNMVQFNKIDASRRPIADQNFRVATMYNATSRPCISITSNGNQLNKPSSSNVCEINNIKTLSRGSGIQQTRLNPLTSSSIQIPTPNTTRNNGYKNVNGVNNLTVLTSQGNFVQLLRSNPPVYINADKVPKISSTFKSAGSVVPIRPQVSTPTNGAYPNRFLGRIENYVKKTKRAIDKNRIPNIIRVKLKNPVMPNAPLSNNQDTILARQLNRPAENTAVPSDIHVQIHQSNVLQRSSAATVQGPNTPPLSYALVSIPQSVTLTSQTYTGVSTIQVPNSLSQLRPNSSMITSTTVASSNNPSPRNTSVLSLIPQQPIATVQRTPVIAPASSRAILSCTPTSNVSPERTGVFNDPQKAGELLISQEQQNSAPNPADGPYIIRDVVDSSSPAILGIPSIECSRLPNTRPEDNTQGTGEARRTSTSTNSTKALLPPETSITPVSTSTANAECTSPTAQPNLPSSSHCHPFIRRMPISGKMRMLFGNNSNS